MKENNATTKAPPKLNKQESVPEKSPIPTRKTAEPKKNKISPFMKVPVT